MCTPIMITEKDIKNMSHELKISIKSFKKKYTNQYPKISWLRCFKQENPCVFFNIITKKCKVYNARPNTCRKYPFNNKNKLPDNCVQIQSLFHELIDKNGQISKESLLHAIQKREDE
jgi:Fe-S-cluster containining protein